MTATNQIAQQLAPMFAEQDARIEARDVAWALDRVAALTAFRHSDEAKAMTSTARYQRMFEIAGGKTYYQMWQGCNEEMIREVMIKNARAVAAKRNAKIAAKLVKAEITQIVDACVAYCRDGFNGTFKINGDRIVTVESILAGGYNIQRLHQRVLVKIS